MKITWVASLLTLALVGPAYAYLDPGSGSMLMQGILASIAVAGVAISGYWSKVRGIASAWLTRRREQR